jgi:hypothetical protein
MTGPKLIELEKEALEQRYYIEKTPPKEEEKALLGPLMLAEGLRRHKAC